MVYTLYNIRCSFAFLFQTFNKMKKIFFAFTLVFLTIVALPTRAQDTLVLKSGKVVCKVERINDKEVVYKRWDNISGPEYTVSKDNVEKIVFKNGTSENFGKITGVKIPLESARHNIKVDFFAPLFHKITLGYEYALTRDINLEAYVSYVSSDLSPHYRGSSYNMPKFQGMNMRASAKFYLNHTTKLTGGDPNNYFGGWFMRVDAIYSALAVSNVTNYTYNYYYPPYNSPAYVGTANSQSYGTAVSFGFQTMLGKHFNFGASLGAGYLFESTVFKPSDILVGSGGYVNYRNVSYDVYKPVVTSGDGYGVTGNFTIGYVFGGRKK